MKCPSEFSHAGYCLDVYLHNTESIYKAYTTPAIDRLVKLQCGDNFTKWSIMQNVIKDWDIIDNALQAAAQLVRKCEHLELTEQDFENVKDRYVDIIIDAAKYDLRNS